jgi:hypothetical protein
VTFRRKFSLQIGTDIMNTAKKVSRRQFLLVGALTGSGLVLSESGCAPNTSQTESSNSAVGIAPVNRKPAAIRKGTLHRHGRTSILQVVTNELPKAHPVIFDSDNNLIGVFTIVGAVGTGAPTDLTKPLGLLTMKHILVDLFPFITFSVTSGKTTVTYQLKPTLIDPPDQQDPRLSVPIGTLSLVEVCELLDSFNFEVDSSGSMKNYIISAQPGPRANENCEPELYQKNHGDLTLDVIGDVLEFMEFSVETVSANQRTRHRHLVGGTAITPIRVMGNKYRRE